MVHGNTGVGGSVPTAGPASAIHGGAGTPLVRLGLTGFFLTRRRRARFVA